MERLPSESDATVTAAESVAAVAADWFVRSRAHDFGATDRDALQSWLSIDITHRRAFEQVERTWQRLGEVRPSGEAAAASASSEQYQRRRAMLAIGGGALALSASGLWLAQPTWLRDVNGARRDFESPRRRRLEAMLPDASRLTLNIDSHVRVQFTAALRRVELLRGEAFFEVAHEIRPFEVAVAEVVLQALDTSFSVRKLARSVEVAVTRGQVVWAAAAQATRQNALPITSNTLSAGHALIVAAGTTSTPSAAADELASWHTGHLVLRDRPLVEVAAELSRYRERPVEIGDVGTARLRISGVVDLMQPDRFLQALPDLVNVSIDERHDRSIIRSR